MIETPQNWKSLVLLSDFLGSTLKSTKDNEYREMVAGGRKVVKVQGGHNCYYWIIEVPKQNLRRRALKLKHELT